MYNESGIILIRHRSKRKVLGHNRFTKKKRSAVFPDKTLRGSTLRMGLHTYVAALASTDVPNYVNNMVHTEVKPIKAFFIASEPEGRTDADRHEQARRRGAGGLWAWAIKGRTDGKEEINAIHNLCEYVMSPQERREKERERENLGKRGRKASS